jgi:hypothetical protein
MSANIKASVDGTQAIIGVGGVDQMTVSNAGVVTANSFVGNVTGNITGNVTGNITGGGTFSGNASSATALATGSTTARTLANRFADVVNVKDFGAVGDYNPSTGIGTDDTAAIQAAIDSLGTKGGMVFIPSNMRCYIGSNINLNVNCSLVGTSDNLPGTLQNICERGSAFIISSSASILIKAASRVEGLTIYRQGITSSASYTEAYIISTFLGDAIQIQASDCAVRNCTIVGFYNAIVNYAPYVASRLNVSNVFIDCRCGVTSQSSGDVTRIENVHCWPVCANVSDAWLNIRAGFVAFNFNTFQDWTKFTNCFCFGYTIGFNLSDVSTAELIGCQVDYPPATPSGNGGPTPSRVQTPNGSVGFYVSNAENAITFVGCATAGVDIGYKIIGSGGDRLVQIDSCHANTHLVSGIENSSSYVTINNFLNRSSVGQQGIGVQTGLGAIRTKITDSTFIGLNYGVYQNSSLSPLTISNPTWNIADVRNRVVNPWIPTIPSATVIQLDGENTTFNISGNVNISDIFGDIDTYCSKVVVFKFLGTLTVNDNTATLRLNGNLNATPGTTLTLVSDGILFYEVARSIN